MTYHTFKSFLSEGVLLEAQRENMSGNVNDSAKKGLRHLKNYIMPYLNKDQRKKTMANFHNYFNETEHEKLGKENGAQHDPDESKTSHVLLSKHGAHDSGTKIKVTGASHDDQGRIILHTAQHGDIPQSKVARPEEIKKESMVKEAFGVEEKLAKNFGCKPAGSTKTAYDFTSHCAEGEGKQTKKLKGVVKEVQPEKEMIKTPFNQGGIKGESKLIKGKMGQSALNWDSKTRQWGFTDKVLGAHYKDAMVKVDKNGKAIPSTDKETPGKMMPLLQHLNKNHSNGVINNSFSIAAPKGSTRKYFSLSDVNSLHVHSKENDVGTTYTIGDKNNLKGVTTMGHLGNKDLDRLDGSLKIESTQSGKSYAAHWPKSGVMKEYANNSVTKPELHRDATKPEHAAEIKSLIDKHNKTLK